MLREPTESSTIGAVLATATPPAGSVEDLSCHPSAHRAVDLKARVRRIWRHHRPPEVRPFATHFKATVWYEDPSRWHEPAQKHHLDMFVLFFLLV